MPRPPLLNIIGQSLFRNYRIVFFIYLLVTLGMSVQSLLIPGRQIPMFEGIVPYHNNYIIFKQSFFHLLNGENLYGFFPSEHYDLYKYSPTFSLMFGFLAYLPDGAGLILWNLLNAFCLFYAFRMLPSFNDKQKILMILFILVELTTCIQNAQSNALMAGLILMAFAMLEDGNFFWAILLITLTVYIKLFGLVAFALLIFYPQKPKLIAYTIFWFVFLGLLPLVAIPFSQLTFQYANWLTLLINDHTVNSGTSVMGWLETWFHLFVDKQIIVLIGVALFLICLTRFKMYKVELFRLLTLSSVLIWVVIFNHRAESPTFIIAVSGVAIWFFSQEQTRINLILLMTVLVFTSLSPTDLFPNSIQENFLDPYEVKVVPCIMVWFKLIYDSFTLNHTPVR